MWMQLAGGGLHGNNTCHVPTEVEFSLCSCCWSALNQTTHIFGGISGGATREGASCMLHDTLPCSARDSSKICFRSISSKWGQLIQPYVVTHALSTVGFMHKVGNMTRCLASVAVLLASLMTASQHAECRGMLATAERRKARRQQRLPRGGSRRHTSSRQASVISDAEAMYMNRFGIANSGQ